MNEKIKFAASLEFQPNSDRHHHPVKKLDLTSQITHKNLISLYLLSEILYNLFKFENHSNLFNIILIMLQGTL